MNTCLTPFLAVAALLALAGCSNEAPPTKVAADTASKAEVKPAPEEPPGFEIESVPVSDAALGEFPYFALPPGYATTDKLSSTIERMEFPFWTGDLYIGVEGRVYQANIRADDGREFSTADVEHGVAEEIAAAGGVEVANMVIPRGASNEVLTREFANDFRNGLCWPSEPVRTYVVHRTDKDIWVHACTYGGIGAAWVIAETASSVPIPEPIGRDVLARQLEEGEVTLPVVFASASAEVPETSAAQLAELAFALGRDPKRRIEISGYAGSMGDTSRASALSVGRAEAVVAALKKAGVAGDRLSVAAGTSSQADAGDVTSPSARIVLARQP